MKKDKQCILFLFTISALCMGCGQKAGSVKEAQTPEAVFAEYSDTLIEQEKGDEEVTVQLHHVAWEEERMILDYTVKAENIENYRICNVNFSADGENSVNSSLDCSLYFEELQKAYRLVGLYEWEDETLSEEAVGEKVKLQMCFPEADDSQGVSVEFDLEIPQLFSTKQIPVESDLTYDKGTTTIEELEVSPFYTRLQTDLAENEDFSDEFYSYEITDEEGNAAGFKGGFDDSLFYSRLPKDCAEAGIAVIRYNQDATYDAVSDRLEITIP